MKNLYKYMMVAVVGLLSLMSCDEKNEIDYSLADQPYILPRGEEGSIDRRIYDIFQKYNVTIRYDFEPRELTYLWNNAWNKYYAPADLSGDKKYVKRFVEEIETRVFEKFEESFIKKNFPARLLLVDSINSALSMSTPKWESVITNNVNHIVVAKVGIASDEYTEKDWAKLGADVTKFFTVFYYALMPKKPIAFLTLRTKNISLTVKDPDYIDVEQTPDVKAKHYRYTCRVSGYVIGKVITDGGTYIAPDENYDYADFANYLTTTPASIIESDFNRFELFKERGVLLELYMRTVVGIDVIKTQNLNCPDDKLSASFFETIK